MKILRGSFFLVFAFFILGCSSMTRFIIVNKSPVAVLLVIDIPKQKAGSVIFSPFGFSFYPFKNGLLDSENFSVYAPEKPGDVHEISLPGQTALEIGHIMNEKYQNSKQAFLNGRVFNLKKLKAANIEIDKENFDQYFKKTSYGVVLDLP
ncbi:MAG: hypothetical protein KF713_19070 [Turneriella sp.]|nr:hypothetical protein [Turneriella sp.]